MELYNDNCFNVFPEIKDNHVDLFVLDLPYANKKFGNCTACKWDTPIDLEKMWKEIKRILKPDGVVIHFCNTKFGFTLIESNPKWFKYDLIWKKSRKVGFLSANKMPLRQHENIYVFKDNQGTYNPQKTEGEPYTDKRNRTIKNVYGEINQEHNTTHTSRHPTSIIEVEEDHENIYVFKDKKGTYNAQKTKLDKEDKRNRKNDGQQKIVYGDEVNLPTESSYNDRHPTSIIEMEPDHENIYIFKEKGGTYNPQKTEGKPYKSRERIEGEGVYIKDTYKRTATEDTSKRHPSSILEYKNPHKTIHPTQKPVDLIEWLIKTYSNENDLVCDFCMGSGTVGVACKNTNRQFIGIEKDDKIFELAYNRINNL